MSSKYFWVCIALIAFLFLINELPAPSEPAKKATGEALIGGSFKLTDQHGNKFTIPNGNPSLIFFGFTFCPAICPADLNIMSQVIEELESKNPDDEAIDQMYNFIFITVDPERDTVEQLKEYMENFHSSIHALTGTREEIDIVLEKFKIFAKKVEMPAMDGMEAYMFDHSAYTYYMDGEGKYITHFAHNSDPTEIAKKIYPEIMK